MLLKKHSLSPRLLLFLQEKREDDGESSFKSTGTICGEHSGVSHHLHALVYLIAVAVGGVSTYNRIQLSHNYPVSFL